MLPRLMLRPERPVAIPARIARALLLAIIPATLEAQEPAAPVPTLRAGATAVVVDVVVRDRKGAPLVDLGAEEFQLFEDGVRQVIGSVTLATPPSSRAGRTTARVPAANVAPITEATRAEPHPSVLALVFDSLSAEGRAAARRAALASLEGIRDTGDRLGVFASDPPLRTLQAYTADRAAIRRAIDAATSSVLDRSARARPGRGALDASTSPTAGAASGGRPDRDRAVSQAEIDAAAAPSLRDGRVENQPGVVVDLLVERMTQRMDESYKEFQRDGYGQNATASLLAIVASLAPLPGRKTLVFFAEDFAVPDAAANRLQAIIDTANRANVAIYTVDVAGLRVHSGHAETSREVAALARRGVGDDDRDASQPYTRDLERNEDVLRQDPGAGLGLLARQTGGFLIDGTNDLAGGFRRIDTDRRFHYLLTYVPANTRFQGEFRRIEVRVSRPRIEVRARPGYVASPEPTATPALRNEAPALAALAAVQRPRDVALRGRALLFPRPDELSDVAIVVALKAGDAGHWVDTASQRYRTDFTILARLVDANGTVVWKGSQRYALHGAVADVGRARAGDVVFFRQTALPGGSYTLDYVVHDELTHKAGTGAESVVVEAVSDGNLEVGSLVVVRGTEPVADADRQAGNPLHVGGLAVTPNVGEQVFKSRTDYVSFYVRVRSPIPALTATLELRHSDLLLASLTVPPPERGPDGSLTYLATVPLVNVAPGSCELRLTIGDGTTTVMRSAAFILER